MDPDQKPTPDEDEPLKPTFTAAIYSGGDAKLDLHDLKIEGFDRGIHVEGKLELDARDLEIIGTPGVTREQLMELLAKHLSDLQDKASPADVGGATLALKDAKSEDPERSTKALNWLRDVGTAVGAKVLVEIVTALLKG